MLYVKEPEAKALKHDIRKALIYAITSSVQLLNQDLKISLSRNIISEFYHSLNRRQVLSNDETDTELKESYMLLTEEL